MCEEENARLPDQPHSEVPARGSGSQMQTFIPL